MMSKKLVLLRDARHASDVAMGAIVVLVRVNASTEAIRRSQCKLHALI